MSHGCAWGDFNEVLSPDEHFGENEREHWQIAAFQEVVQDCRFVDLGFSGLPFTWDNWQEGNRNVKVRLDRALGDHNFLDLLADSSVKHVPLAESNHCALVIHIQKREQTTSPRRRRRGRCFRYENMWQRHEDHVDFVQQTWDPGRGVPDLKDIATSLAKMQSSLSAWDKEVFGSVKRKIASLKQELEAERTNTLYRGPTAHEKELMNQLSESLAREEIMERQRSRVEWLREGDRNTGYFQAKAKARARSNRIQALKSSDGELVCDQTRLEELANNFYQDLFMAQTDLEPELVCQHVPRKVSEAMCDILEQPFLPEEVEKALFQMGPSKAPGPDSFTAGFFQRHWALVKESVISAVLGFLNGGEMSNEVNKTVLVLIPKVSNPQELTQFRPIALCNVLYKICSKTGE